MKKKINIAELLKDCPSGMELNCTMYDNLYFDKVDEECRYPIGCYTIYDGCRTSVNFTEFGEFNNYGTAKCVIFPKDRTTWEKFVSPCKFKDGDILATDLGSVFILNTHFNTNECYGCYTGVCCDGVFYINEPFAYKECCNLATKEEREELFQTIGENGYKWNAETKTLEKLIGSKFNDGDIISSNDGRICIFKKNGKIEGTVDYYCGIPVGDKHSLIIKNAPYGHFGEINKYRLATEEEKQKLFDTIKYYSYKWNQETKTLEKLLKPNFKVGDIITNGKTFIAIGYIDDEYYYEINRDIAHRLCIKNQDEWELVPNKFDINTFKPFDQVLVRLTNNCVWIPKFFSHLDNKNVKYYPFVTTDNVGYPQCVPYKGNEHLCRTTNDCNKFYKVWEK